MRLIILMSVCVGTVSLLGGAYGYRKWRRAQGILESKPLGLEAYKKGEMVGALNYLQVYVQAHDEDIEALDVYVKVREKLPEPDGSHLQRAMTGYRRLAALRPDDLTVKRALVKLYAQMDMNTETTQGVDDIIKMLVTEINRLGTPAVVGTKPATMTADAALTKAIGILKEREKSGDKDVREKYIDPLKEALALKEVGAARLHRMKEADQAAEMMLVLDPGAESILLKLNVMQANQESKAVILAKMEELTRGRDNDIESAILQARVYLGANEKEKGIQWARAAAKLEMTSERVVLPLVDAMERLDSPELFIEARAVLEKGREKFKSADLDDAYFSRLVMQEQYERAADEIAKVDAAKRPNTMAMRLIALGEMARSLEAAGQKLEADKKKAEALTVLKALAECGARWDTMARGWHDVLEGVYCSDKPRDRDVIEACRKAAMRDPGNGFYFMFWGDAFRASGDSNAALQQWQIAARCTPSWSKPLARASRYYAAVGDPVQALQLARMANDRLPDRKETITAIVISWHGAISRGAMDNAEKQSRDLLKFIGDHKGILALDENTVPLEVMLIQGVNGKPAAIARVREVISAVDKENARVLLSLAVVSHQQQLETGSALEDACQAKFESLCGMTSDLASTKCRILLDDMNAQKRAEIAAQNGTPSTQPVPATKITAATIKSSFMDSKGKMGKVADAEMEKWDIAECQLLEFLKDSEAHDRWKAVVGVRSNSAVVQWSALSAASVRADHNLKGLILDRLEALVTNTGLTWRLEKGQWLLEDQTSRDSLEKAAKLLTLTVASAPESVAARKLLARGYELTGNLSNAITELNRATELDTQDLDLKLDLAALYERQNDPGRALDQLNRVIASRFVSDAQKIRAGGLLAQAGDPGGARKILSLVQGKNAAVQQMLPALYWQQGDLVNAYDGYLGLVGLERPKDARGNYVDGPLTQIPNFTPSAEMIEQALPFFASTNHDEAAMLSLKKLDTADATEAQKHAIRGSYLATVKKWDEGIKELDAAVKADSKNSNYWRRLIATLLSAERYAEGIKTAADAKSALPGDAALAAMESFSKAKYSIADQDLQVYLVACVLSPSQARGLTDVTTNLLATEMAPPVLAHKLRLVADRNPESVALQVFAIRKLMTAGLLEEATVVAQRAMLNDATAAQPALLATLCLAQAGKWDEALAAAQKWKALSAGSVNPDLVIAASYIKLSRSAEAVGMLQKYVSQIDPKKAADPEYHSVIMLFASAQLQQGQTAAAEDLVWGLVEKDKSWREDWTRLASDHMKQANLAVAEQWMQKLAKIIPEDDLEGQMIVAMGWFRMGKNFNYTDGINKGTMLAEKITQAKDGDPKKRAVASMLFGSLREQQGDGIYAERSYRQALELDPGLFYAANNLAMLLSKSGKLEEAEKFAQQAVASVPTGPQADSIRVPLYDTLATILSAAKKTPEAITAIDKSILLDPRNPMWLMTKAEIWVAGGRADYAREVLKKFEDLQVDLSKAPDLKRRYDVMTGAVKMRIPGPATSPTTMAQ